MIWGIVTNTPLWVWPLLALMIRFAIVSGRDRRTPLVGVYALPLLVVFSFMTVSGFDVGPAVWVAFAAGYALAARFGWRRQGPRITGRSATHVDQRGDWMTGTAILATFAIGYARDVTFAIAPDLFATLALPLAASTLSGLSSGFFAGKAARIVATPPESQQRAVA